MDGVGTAHPVVSLSAVMPNQWTGSLLAVAYPFIWALQAIVAVPVAAMVLVVVVVRLHQTSRIMAFTQWMSPELREMRMPIASYSQTLAPSIEKDNSVIDPSLTYI